MQALDTASQRRAVTLNSMPEDEVTQMLAVMRQYIAAHPHSSTEDLAAAIAEVALDFAADGEHVQRMARMTAERDELLRLLQDAGVMGRG